MERVVLHHTILPKTRYSCKTCEGLMTLMVYGVRVRLGHNCQLQLQFSDSCIKYTKIFLHVLKCSMSKNNLGTPELSKWTSMEAHKYQVCFYHICSFFYASVNCNLTNETTLIPVWISTQTYWNWYLHFGCCTLNA